MRINMRCIGTCLLLVALAGCQTTKAFEIVKDPKPDEEGFINRDTLQVVGVGYAPAAVTAATKRRSQAWAAAVINARMMVIDFLLSGLKTAEYQDKYMHLATRTGQFSASRYKPPIYSDELKKGGYRVDSMFESLGLKGYVHKRLSYDAKQGKMVILYRVIRAGLVERARTGFSE